MREFLLSLCLILAITTQAQNTRLSVQPNEIRVIGGNFVVEKQTLIVIPDADYAITADGKIFILPEPSSPRILYLPPATSFALREITIINKSTTTNSWKVAGGFVTRETYGQPPFNPEDNVMLNKGEKLVLYSDGTKWWDINSSGDSGTAAFPPKVEAGQDRTLPSNATQVSLAATVTPGNTPIYTTVWHITRKPDGSTPQISDTTADNITVSNMVPGNYTFRVTVTDDLGLRAIDSVKVYIKYTARMFSSGGYLNNVYDSATGRQAWVYLPDGYNPEDSVKYPMVLFLHGNGENGTDPSAMLTVSGGLPKLLYDNAFPMKSIVIMPQLTTGYWQSPQGKKAYDWAIAGYKVDLDRVYVTGLSSGGGGTCEVLFGNPSLFAAYLAVASLENVMTVNGAAVKNIPGMFAHGYQDVYVTVRTSMTMVDVINRASPVGIYPPLIRTTWRGNHNEFFWNNYIYDKRVAPIDFENDFLLMHTRSRATTAANYVLRAETYKDYTDYMMAKRIVDKLTSGQDKTSLLNRLSALNTLLTTNNNYYIIDPGVAAYAEVTNTNRITSAAANTTKSNLVSVSGATSAKGFTILGSSNPVMLDTCPANEYLGFEQSTYRDGLQVIDTGVSMKLTGLSQSASYDIRVFYSNKSQIRTSQTGFTITANGRYAESDEDGYNTTKYIDLFNIQADTNGEINMRLLPMFGYYSVVNVMMVREKLAPPPVKRAQFDFALTSASVPSGWTGVHGDPVAEVIEVEDASTGWLLSTVSTANWRRLINSIASDNGGMETGTFSTEFPVGVTKSYFQNWNLRFTGSNFNLEVKLPDGQGLEAGTYQVKIMSSVKQAVYNTGEGELYVKFGDGATQMQRLVPTNNVSQFKTFTGRLKAGEIIRISVNRSSLNLSDNAFINGLIIEKVD